MEQIRSVSRELVQLGCRHVDVTGGEPLLPPAWDDLCREFTEIGLRTAVITNGTLLDS